MSAHTELIVAIGTSLGAAGGAFWKGWDTRRNREQESRLAEANKGKLDAEAVQIITSAAATLVTPLESQVINLSARVEVLEKENAATKSTLQQALDYIRSLLSWVHEHMPDKTPPRPPRGLGI